MESFLHILQKLWETIRWYSVSPPAVLLLPFSPERTALRASGKLCFRQGDECERASLSLKAPVSGTSERDQNTHLLLSSESSFPSQTRIWAHFQ